MGNREIGPPSTTSKAQNQKLHNSKNNSMIQYYVWNDLAYYADLIFYDILFYDIPKILWRLTYIGPLHDV